MLGMLQNLNAWVHAPAAPTRARRVKIQVMAATGICLVLAVSIPVFQMLSARSALPSCERHCKELWQNGGTCSPSYSGCMLRKGDSDHDICECADKGTAPNAASILAGTIFFAASAIGGVVTRYIWNPNPAPAVAPLFFLVGGGGGPAAVAPPMAPRGLGQ